MSEPQAIRLYFNRGDCDIALICIDKSAVNANRSGGRTKAEKSHEHLNAAPSAACDCI